MIPILQPLDLPQNQVLDTPQEIPFLNILQHLLRIDPKEPISDVVWDTAERLAHRATLLESILAGASKRSRINGIIDDLIATVVLGKSGEAGDNENPEVEEAETSKEEFSSFSLTSTTSGDLDKSRQGRGR